MDFHKFKVPFLKTQKFKYKCFDNNSTPLTLQLFNNLGIKFVAQKIREEQAFV